MVSAREACAFSAFLVPASLVPAGLQENVDLSVVFVIICLPSFFTRVGGGK